MSSSPDAGEFDTTVTGERKSVDAGTVQRGIAVESESSSVEFVPGSDSVALLLAGDHNSVTARGDDEELVLHCTGSHNTITVGRDMRVRTETDRGTSISIEREDFDAGGEPELVRQTKSEAYRRVGWFGYDLVSYQTEQAEREYCHYCGNDRADTVVERREERVLALFGLRITVRTVAASDECPNCTPVEEADVELSSEERRDIYR
ncbi:hypothetical protein [Halorientalis marina]|uniref:hypothetical protein n=1 Tax=Halorientalis marina TaxID=2931976 RepID=UPI001FF4BA25|nr:hypothetical protein [Halorientalis marina]